jgi:hypothetical protein
MSGAGLSAIDGTCLASAIHGRESAASGALGLIWRNRDCDKAPQIAAPFDLGVETVRRVGAAARDENIASERPQRCRGSPVRSVNCQRRYRAGPA